MARRTRKGLIWPRAMSLGVGQGGQGVQRAYKLFHSLCLRTDFKTGQGECLPSSLRPVTRNSSHFQLYVRQSAGFPERLRGRLITSQYEDASYGPTEDWEF
ncbi:hypothetical protein JDV02_002563 [Purpureocillium takamizusanense]|uniref:Uncharacterized protein n=1 Tax=Purpureocillium takamizusanense TaxID=2060973 RepID=A0A9Q8QB96_9HYPO|nr:uncharacterized protein JDV02_002563 [Purpureocillium takamizusanense]UNI16092.1 hypothetical protein JDV02_002563 [Purpureocillium takamizusanense]